MKSLYKAGNYEFGDYPKLGRMIHQPDYSVKEVPEYTPEQLKKVFGKTAVVVMAMHLEGQAGYDALSWVMFHLLGAQVPSIKVLLPKDPETAALLQSAIDTQKQGNKTTKVRSTTMTKSRIEKARKASCNFELYGIPKAVIDEGIKEVERSEDIDKLMIISGGEYKIQIHHMVELHLRFNRRPGEDDFPECVTSWISWNRRMPILLSKKFLDRIENGGLCKPLNKKSTSRPIPNIDVEEVVFAEEPIEEVLTAPDDFAAFNMTVSLSALEAVNLAKVMCGRNELHRWHEDPADIVARLDGADRLVYDCAVEAIAMSDKINQSRTMKKEIHEADWLGHLTKLEFPIFQSKENRESLAYLDTAATAQRLGCAIEAQNIFDSYENANVYRGAYKLSADANAYFEDARRQIETCIGSTSMSTILTTNATASLNLVVQAWGTQNVHKGDIVAVSAGEHHSNFLSWMCLCERIGAHLVRIPIKGDGRIDMDAYAKILEQKPKIVCVAQISNVLGMLNPVKEMAEMAHAAGARILVDAAQSAPHVGIDVKELGVDFLSFASHKMYGPLGVGGLWVAPEAFAEMDPLICGGGAVSHVGHHTYYLREGATQYELGTPPISQTIGFAAAIDWLFRTGMDVLHTHDKALTKYMMAFLKQMDWITVWGDHNAKDGYSGLACFTVAGMPAAEVGIALGAMGVAVRCGEHCSTPLMASMGTAGTVRASIGIYNTDEDIEALVTGLLVCRKIWDRMI